MQHNMYATPAITVYADDEVGLLWPRPAHIAKSITLRVCSSGVVDFKELKVAAEGEIDFPGKEYFKSLAKALAPKGRWSWTLPLKDCIGTCMKQACVCVFFPCITSSACCLAWCVP